MKISFYDKKANTITFLCPEVLTTKDLRSYFSNIALKKSDINEAHGIVDFTMAHNFVSKHEEFYSIKPLLKDLAKKRTVLKITFKARNFYQYGMARMFTSIADDTGVEFLIDYQKEQPNGSANKNIYNLED
jgi:hypothetical protein